MRRTAATPRKGDKLPVGELRPSQMVYSFGIGAIVDLPRIAVMVMGLEDWDTTYCREIVEERLLQAVQADLGAQVQELRTPPTAPGDSLPGAAPNFVGVPVAAFPRWAVCPYCRYLGPLSDSNPLVRLKANPYRPERTAYVHTNCSGRRTEPEMVPVRFLMACKAGHLDDFPWQWFVHKGKSPCNGRLFLHEFGFGEVADITVKCEACEASRRLTDAFGADANLPPCTARRPHLRDREGVCSEPARVILLGASNSWFPVTRSTLHIPTKTNHLDEMVETHWGSLKDITSLEILRYERKRGGLTALAEFDEATLWGAMETFRATPATTRENPSDVKTPEWEIFASGQTIRGRDLQLRPVEAPEKYRHLLEQVVLVEKLREVKALVGFTRIESPGEFSEASEMPARQRAPLSRKPTTWAPATEVRGEGIFLKFDLKRILTWGQQPEVQKRERFFRDAHRQWRDARGLDPDQHFPGIGYILIHSLSHALMRQVTLECGYSAASIRERIYWTGMDGAQTPMAGLLIYTAAPDSEGTLGGLVSLGHPQKLSEHLDQALEMMRLCASDPLCAEHLPVKDGMTLHGAACHACLFSPETSCERSNKYLDRSVLVETTQDGDIAYS